MPSAKKSTTHGLPKPPPVHDWRTTDEDEINKRRLRAREESFHVVNTDPRHPFYSNFNVQSASGQIYSVEIRDLEGRHSLCDCIDFRINGLGFCKHVEVVTLHLQARHRRLMPAAKKQGSNRVEIALDEAGGTLKVSAGMDQLPASVARAFDKNGRLASASPEEALAMLRRLQEADVPQIRLSQEIAPWLENRRRLEERVRIRRDYELKVQSGEWPQQETTVPLFPYQREGMLHLAFGERALLADEMGLGKTIQAIAACALLHRLGQARRVLVVTPASLKTEWEEQIRKFTTLDYQLVFGGKQLRLRAYGNRASNAGAFPFFTLVNYEQMLGDALDVNRMLAPEVVILDEAQRIKNWGTKTAQAVKRLKSRYAFVLTGTPIENRIDELHSLMDFLNPSVLGPLFRFNRDFYQLDDRGRPSGYRNLDLLHARIKPFLLRRRKAEVETELPERTDRHHFVPLSDGQRANYADHELQVSRLLHAAQRRPLTKQELDKLQRELAMMRMICDTNYILDPSDRACPKLAELERVLEECRENDAKVIVFSEWERMLELVRDYCEREEIGFAWHTGSVPQLRRRAEINAFKNDPDCRVFLSTDAGATGLNLQNASVVVNCDLPWNPAKLEQRVARAWRKHQTRPVTVINLISENTIEHRMLQTLALKQSIASSVLDEPGKVKEIQLRSGHQAFAERLQQLVSRPPTVEAARPKPPLPPDRALAFARRLQERLQGTLIRCEERYPQTGAHSVIVVVVERDAVLWSERIKPIHEEHFGPGQSDPLAPVRLEVVDRATNEAIQRMMETGLLGRTTRAARPLFPAETATTAAPLSETELARAKAHRDKAGRKLKMANILGTGGFEDEARGALRDTVLALASALAVEGRFAEPGNLQETLLPPLSRSWSDSLDLVRDLVENSAAPWEPAARSLEKLLAEAA